MDVYAYLNPFKCGLNEKRKIQEYAKTHGLNIKHVFKDNTPDTKEGVYSMFERIGETDIKTVLVFSTDSLWCDEEVHCLTVNKLKSMRAGVISVTDPDYSVETDTITENSSVYDYVTMLTHAFTAVNLSKGRSRKAEQGKKPCGNAPYGYRWNEAKDIIIDDDEAEKLNTIFDAYLKLKSLSKLEEHLRSIGICNRNNRPFRKGTLSVMLQNDFYTGIVKYQGQKTKGKHTPIIDGGLFWEVNDILKSNTKTTKI